MKRNTSKPHFLETKYSAQVCSSSLEQDTGDKDPENEHSLQGNSLKKHENCCHLINYYLNIFIGGKCIVQTAELKVIKKQCPEMAIRHSEIRNRLFILKFDKKVNAGTCYHIIRHFLIPSINIRDTFLKEVILFSLEYYHDRQ